MLVKKIGIIGSGVVAQTLASGFVKHGYEVRMGSRSPDKLSEFKTKSNGKVKVGEVTDVAAFGDIVVLAVRGSGASSALALAGAANLNGKTVIDVTNPIDDTHPPENGVLRYYTDMNESQMERLQKQVPDAHFVKAFNSIGNAFMVNPDFGKQKPTMFYCGNDESAKKEVAVILEQFGFEPEDMGRVEAARPIEALCVLWCIPGLTRNEWNHTFKLLKK
ncbi:MAG: NAD(P)-binding domain-containing protein [Candidatus Diapherotrites archaeon]|nr:NAD(P)-binding domain-containing protein [Candidatus Diapherotrites archaeon]